MKSSYNKQQIIAMQNMFYQEQKDRFDCPGEGGYYTDEQKKIAFQKIGEYKTVNIKLLTLWKRCNIMDKMEYYNITENRKLKTIKFEDYCTLFKEINSHNPKIIGIDGDKGTGKTNLSYHIGANLLGTVISLDDFICTDQKCFVNAINYGLLCQRVEAVAKLLIIEGICLLEILERINVKSNYLIYCREISENTNIWHSEDKLKITEQDLLNRKLEDLKDLEAEITKYHFNYKPMQKANILYDVINQKKR